jgi:hypothetical protein
LVLDLLKVFEAFFDRHVTFTEKPGQEIAGRRIFSSNGRGRGLRYGITARGQAGLRDSYAGSG